jgi:exodeoxyribonuclease VII large subunit
MIGQTPVFSVSDFVAIFNQSLEMMYPQVCISAELANFRISKGMWVYGDLKDDSASVRLFGTTRQLPGPLEDGMMLEVYGRPYLHPRFGFSIQIDSVRPVGSGAIKKAQDLLRIKLEKEGLFEAARKRGLPFAPEKVGLIASSESAAYSDFFKIIQRRWPMLDVVEYETLVQGAEAPAQIARAIEVANQHIDLEVLIIIRGGGSKDDLSAFDHEQVVRAVAASRIPTMVAIGHERDLSLAELAADSRASTPSNAAEMLVPDSKAERAELAHISSRLGDILKSHIDSLESVIEHTKIQSEDLLKRIVSNLDRDIAVTKQLVGLLNPRQPLERGFVLVRNKEGRVMRSVVSAQGEQALTLEFVDGKLQVSVEESVK